MTDHRIIGDFAGLGLAGRLKVMQRYAGQAESHLRESLSTALRQFKTVLVVSHVPMFYEACLEPIGGMTGAEYLPYYAWHQGGIAIGDVLRAQPDGRVIALCGHTHTICRVKIDERASIRVAKAVYDDPAIEDVLELEML
jgi:hypothetical protein